ncbi:MAG: patatin-like phospholipase family protein [Deltaproteobacteria bacterium]|nr:patatin-like phospholipase family protein [Deltaproteobacteria bacterium]
MTTPRSSSLDAVVLSGGGAKGAYEIGILKALCEGRSSSTGFEPLEIDIFTGTSVGAFNAAFLVGLDDLPPLEAVARLERIWLDRIGGLLTKCGNGVFRARVGPLNGLQPACLLQPISLMRQTLQDAGFWAKYMTERATEFVTSQRPVEFRALDTVDLASLFSAEPLYQLISDSVDLEGLRRSKKSLTVAATNWEQGKVRLFDRMEIADRVGSRALAASAAIPGLFPPVEIDGQQYLDGGVLLSTPLKPAIKDGADVLHVIYLDPQVAEIPLRSLPNTLDTMYRLYLIMGSALINADLDLAGDILRDLEHHHRRGHLDDDFQSPSPGSSSKLSRRIQERLEEGDPYRPVSIHRYRPSSDLGGGAGLLAFDVRFISQLIETGYQDAIHHDCQKAGCVVENNASRRRTKS